MYDNRTEIYNKPARGGLALCVAFAVMLRARGFERSFGQRVEHAVAGTGTKNEIISEGRDTL
jgi:hypothetical protein